jgi:putative heme-binding domain-containing protein
MAVKPNRHVYFSDKHGGGNDCEKLNLALPGRFYGHNSEKFPGRPPAQQPLVRIQSGVAPTGICFNRTDNEFGGTAGDLFIACWGPDFFYDRGSIVRVRLFKQEDGSYRAQEFPFAHEVPKTTAVAFGPQGNLYATLFGRETHGHLPSGKPDGAIYRFIPAEWIQPQPPETSKYPLVHGNAEAGKKIFKERGCVNCHAFDSGETMPGPDLGGLGELYSVEEMMTSITQPSAGIKTGFETEQIVLKNGDVLTGRIFTSSADEITMIVPGRGRVRFARSDLASQQTLSTSLMPEGLLSGLTQTQIDDLLAYLGVRDRRGSWLVRTLRKMEEVTRPVFPGIRCRERVIIAIGLAGLLLCVRWARRLWKKNR